VDVALSLDLALIQAIDQRVAAGAKTLTAMGTVTSWSEYAPLDIDVTFDGTTVSVPCKVYGSVSVAEGDRVGLVKIGRWWMVHGTYTKTWRQLLGGTQWIGAGNLVTGLGSTELVIMTSDFIFIPSNTNIDVTAGVRVLDTGTAGTTYIFRLREGTTTSDTPRAEFTWTSDNLSFGYNLYLFGNYDSGASSTAEKFCVTAQRVGGGGFLTMLSGGQSHNTHIRAIAMGAAGVMAPRTVL
jgi:hypothetical protein